MNTEANSKEITMVVKVKEILEKHPSARDNDYILYGFVLNEYGYSTKKITFADLIDFTRVNKLPTIESIGRSRRKVQELYPELIASKHAKVSKDRREQEFKALAKIKKGDIKRV